MPYQNRYVIRPFVRSYGLISTLISSPGMIRIRNLRNFPDKWPIISCSFSSLMRKCPAGSDSSTVPRISINCFSTIGVRIIPTLDVYGKKENGASVNLTPFSVNFNPVCIFNYSKTAFILRIPALEASSFFIRNLPNSDVFDACGPPQISLENTPSLSFPTVNTFT